jgi:hypothetical protein
MFFKCSNKKIQEIGQRAVWKMVGMPEGIIKGADHSKLLYKLSTVIQANEKYEILFFTKWYNPFSATLAKGDVNGYRMWLNTMKLNRSDESLGGTISHELCHNLGFTHNGDYPTDENLKTVPYVVGKWVKDNYGK